MMKTVSSRRISSAMAALRASRTVLFSISVPSGQSGLVSDLGAAGALASAGADLGSSASSSFASGAEALDAVSMSSALSPSSSKTAIGVLTLTPSVPSSIRILPMVPSSTASNSIVALSVSISARRSPALTVSPSLTSHFASVPSSMVGERAGMSISVGIASLSLPVGHLAHGVDHLGGRGQRQLFEIGRVGHGHVLAGAVDDRRVEIVERLLHQH